jgi:anti-anti-sigma factor
MSAEEGDDVGLLVDVVRRDTSVTLRLIGELDLATAPHIGEVARRLFEADEDGPFVLDLADVTFCDSSGLRFILHLLAEGERRGRDVTLSHVRRAVRRTFEVTGLDHLVPIGDSPDDAMSIVDPSG